MREITTLFDVSSWTLPLLVRIKIKMNFNLNALCTEKQQKKNKEEKVHEKNRSMT